MPIGSLIGGLISAGGASAAGAGALAQSNALNNTNSQGFTGYIMPGYSAVGTLNALTGNGFLNYDGTVNSADAANALKTADATATSAIKGSPLYSMLAPQIGETFQASPSYAFRLQQGQNALANSGAARGMTLSGAQAKALTDYNQNSASQEYQNWYNNYSNLVNGAANSYMNTLYNLSGQGANAVSQSASARNQAMVPGIQANASGQAAAANSLGQGIAGSINSLGGILGYGLGNGWFSSSQNSPLGGSGGFTSTDMTKAAPWAFGDSNTWK